MSDSAELRPLIKSTYSEEEAELLTGFPFSGRSLEDLAKFKGMHVDALSRKLDDLAGRGIIWKDKSKGEIRYSLNDSYFVFLRSYFGAGKTGCLYEICGRAGKSLLPGRFLRTVQRSQPPPDDIRSHMKQFFSEREQYRASKNG
jgi:hypothetical protein